MNTVIFGPYDPISVDVIPEVGEDWISPDNMLAIDGVSATSSLPSGEPAKALRFFFDFSAIPDNATILGAQVEIKAKQLPAENCNVYDWDIYFIDEVAFLISARPNGYEASPLPLDYEIRMYGSSADLWHEEGGWFSLDLTVPNLKSENFCLAVDYRENDCPGEGISTVYVDGIRLAVYCSLPLESDRKVIPVSIPVVIPQRIPAQV